MCAKIASGVNFINIFVKLFLYNFCAYKIQSLLLQIACAWQMTHNILGKFEFTYSLNLASHFDTLRQNVGEIKWQIFAGRNAPATFCLAEKVGKINSW